MLKHITFTGIDNRTDVRELMKLQQEFPLVEFGFLAGANWKDGGNRYTDPVYLKQLKGSGLNLSLHLCGEYARRPLKEGWHQVEKVFKKDLDLFQRVQLNVVGSRLKKDYDLAHLADTYETIIQQKSPSCMPIYQGYRDSDYEEMIHTSTSVLFDTSGGRGKYKKDFEVVAFSKYVKQGFAGGISSDNCIEVIERIESVLTPEKDYWIDMETGVRTDSDWFSIEKCREVCEKVYEYLRKSE